MYYVYSLCAYAHASGPSLAGYFHGVLIIVFIIFVTDQAVMKISTRKYLSVDKGR